MEQDRWVKESESNHKNYKFVAVLGLIAAVIVGVTIFSCGEKKVKRLSFDKGYTILHADETDRLYVTIEPGDLQPELLWKSTDESVVTVIDGVVTGHNPGKATVTATVIDQADISAACEYVVEEQDVDMQTLDILEEPIVLRPGGHQQMNVSCTPENQNEMILWSSSNEAVARVSPQGKVEALRVGVARIIAKSERTGVADTATVSVEGAGINPSTVSGQLQPSQEAKPAPVAKPEQKTVAKPVQKPVTKAVPTKDVKPAPVKPAPAQTSKPVTKTPAKSTTSGIRNLGYANFRGSWPNDVNGRMEFKSTHVIDSKDPKGRMASPGDYVIGEWSDGHLVQGIWYGSDNQVKGSILIGK